MANVRTHVIRGISEVGAVRAAADVSFGKTPPDGVSIAFAGGELEVESGQSPFLEDLFNTSLRADVTVRLLYGDLLNVQEVLGLPIGTLTGDLGAGTPTPEVLGITGAGLIGTREDHLYVVTPGPTGNRRYDFFRTKPRVRATLAASRDNNLILEATWSVLRPASGNVITITDNP